MSASVTAPRLVALEVLRRCRSGDLADRAIAALAGRLEARERAWLQELVYGTLRLRGRLDHQLAAFVRGRLDGLDADVLDILRLGAYQLLEMDGVPAYAAVSQSVELARAAGAGRAAGLVNGVLQALRRGAASVTYPDPDADPVGYLTTAGSHPRWLVERWVERWGAEEASRLVEANNRRPGIYLTPAHGVAPGEAVQTLAAAGIAAEEVPGFPTSVRLEDPANPAAALEALPGVVQDPAAASVVRYAAFPPGARVLDLSAAPGGKTIGLASSASYVVAADLSARRLRRVRSNVQRVGLAERVGLVAADGRWPPFRPQQAVLLDAPCTGTGTLRRHPDGRWRLQPEDLTALAALQDALLNGVAPVVAPGGLLVYSTCSLEPEENEERVARFLADHEEFHLEPPIGAVEDSMLEAGMLTVLPQRHGVDGAFAARLRRSE